MAWNTSKALQWTPAKVSIVPRTSPRAACEAVAGVAVAGVAAARVAAARVAARVAAQVTAQVAARVAAAGVAGSLDEVGVAREDVVRGAEEAQEARKPPQHRRERQNWYEQSAVGATKVTGMSGSSWGWSRGRGLFRQKKLKKSRSESVVNPGGLISNSLKYGNFQFVYIGVIDVG